MSFKEGDRIRVLIEPYTDIKGVVEMIALNKADYIGVKMPLRSIKWFRPEEIEKA